MAEVPDAQSPANRLEPAAAERRFGWLALTFVAAYFAIIAVQHGDFWPFSRFGMFSKPGKGFKRALVLQVPEGVPLAEVAADKLPGPPFAIGTLGGIEQNDLSAAVRAMHTPLLPEERAVLAAYFHSVPAPLVLYLVDGRLRSKDRSLRIRYRPIARLRPTGVEPITLAPAEAR